ncbi:MAG: Rrf2 family transcriptional regulator [Pirellulales bacterium]|nr:Rrf2 family transcriptional regulator [Pirellulales bacterium]
MKISAKVEYASIAMLELASRYGSDQPVRIRDIADRHGIPSRFLVQILLQLKGAGYVASTRGAAGGYRLVKKPAKVTLGEVMSVIDGSDTEVASNTDADSDIVDVLLETWNDVARLQREKLDAITLADLVEKTNQQAEDMYYI